MNRIGIRELRQQASEVLRRVGQGETFEVTDRGRPVAVLTQAAAAGLEQLDREGLVRPADGDLLEVVPTPLPPGSRPPSAVVSDGRAG